MFAEVSLPDYSYKAALPDNVQKREVTLFISCFLSTSAFSLPPPPFSFFFFLNSLLHKNIVLLAIDKALLLNNSTAICSQHSPLLLCLCCDVISHENKLNCWNFPDHTIFLSFLHISLHFLCTCQETIVNFAKRCGQIIDLAIKWAPDETKAILEVHTYTWSCWLAFFLFLPPLSFSDIQHFTCTYLSYSLSHYFSHT